MESLSAVPALSPERAMPVASCRVVLGVMLWLSAAVFLAASDCNPRRAPALYSVTIENEGSTALGEYPVAVALDQNNFTFSHFDRDGSEVAAWDAGSRKPLPHWLESYDSKAGKGLLWIKVPFVQAQGQFQVWLTAGRIPRCSLRPGNGYEVFPFFSHVDDLRNWHREPSLSLTNAVTVGPLHVEDRQVIQSDGLYNSTPSVAKAGNSDWVLSYLKGTNHINGHTVVLRRSEDEGKTWSPEVVYFDTSKPDPSLVTAPNGELLISFVKQNPNAISGAAYSRSNDDGLTWGPFTFFDNPVSNTFAMTSYVSTRDDGMYGAGYGPSTADPTLESPSLWISTDDGITWTKRSEIAQAGDPGANETGIARVGRGSLLAIERSDNNVDTYGRRSDNRGMTWGPLLSYTTQLGALQFPQMIRTNGALIVLGRQELAIPGVAGNLGSPQQFVAYVSYDEGRTFRYGTVLDTYTGLSIDGGYCWPLRMSDGRIFVVYYADSHDLRQPDIKSLILRVDEPHEREGPALHLLTQLAATQATHALSFGLSRYSLDFRFRSRPTPAGSQFSVGLSGSSDDTQMDLVRWELPSTHATDPTSISGFIANGEFVPLLNSFAYGQEYRVRTIVDEMEGTEEPQILDLFGQVTEDMPAQPFAHGTTLHPSALTIGNNSTLRATDTLLDFVFIRPVAEEEPDISLTRIH
jgi:hypothetical protein